MIGVSGVPSSQIAAVWPRVEPLLAAGFAKVGERFDADHWIAACMQRRAALWIAFDGREPLGAALTIRTGDGDMMIWAVCGRRFRAWGGGLLSLITQWAREEGCRRIETRAVRSGWKRWAAGYGFAPAGSDGRGRHFVKEI